MIAVDKIFVISPESERQSDDELYQQLSLLPWKAPVEIFSYQDQSFTNPTNRYRVESDPHASIILDDRDFLMVQTHQRIWRTAHEQKLKCILVLEYDVKTTGSHFHVLDTTEHWDLMYLGRNSCLGDTPINGGIVIPGFSEDVFAYLLNDRGLSRFISCPLADGMISLTDFLGAIQGIHPDRAMSAYYDTDLIFLAPMKNFIQRNAPVVIESGEDVRYVPLNNNLFEGYESDHDRWVKQYVNAQLVDLEFDLICDEPIPNVYSFPLFTARFCNEIMAEAEHFGKWTNYRYKDNQASIDIMLNSIGFDEIYADVLKRYVHPLFNHKYHLQQQLCDQLLSQHFIVRYVAEEQRHLGLHNDACDISMIVTLNKDYEGGGTFFPKFGKLIKHDEPGYASIHPGFVGYIHGARPTTRGKRYILASFFFRK